MGVFLTTCEFSLTNTSKSSNLIVDNISAYGDGAIVVVAEEDIGNDDTIEGFEWLIIPGFGDLLAVAMMLFTCATGKGTAEEDDRSTNLVSVSPIFTC